MSGYVDEWNGQSEPQVMRDRAVIAGVPLEDILIDEEGINTVATARNTARIMRDRGFRTVLTVSHYYHQPRIKMLFRRQGLSAYTVPAHMTRRLVKEPYFLAREVAAFYSWFLLG